MNTNGTNPGMSVEDYENMAVQKSNTAKRVAAGAAVLVGGAAIAGGAAYAASPDTNPADEALTVDDVVNGAEVAEAYQPVEETHETQTTTQYVYVEKPAAEEEAEESDVTWDETKNFYEDGEKTGSVEYGTVDGHKFALVDVDGDEHADGLFIDMNNNGEFENDELVATYDPSDHVHMGHETARVTNNYDHTAPDYIYTVDDPGNEVAQNNGMIHNNFEDEKTGESYHDDFAENNPDYNPDAYDGNDNYLAENNSYDEGDDVYSADMEDGLAQETSYDDKYDGEDIDVAETYDSDSYDSMMGAEEFMG